MIADETRSESISAALISLRPSWPRTMPISKRADRADAGRLVDGEQPEVHAAEHEQEQQR